jgi:hypothetical protein
MFSQKKSPAQARAAIAPALFAVALVTPGITLAQAPATISQGDGPFEIEGPITAVTPGSGTILVMGITIHVPVSVAIKSPTATVTLDQLTGAPMPGRYTDQPGFIGGTAIITGNVVGGTYEAATVFAEPAENVLRGPLSCTYPYLRMGGFSCGDGVELSMLTDERMPAGPIRNQFGFAVNPATLQTGTFAAVEGYHGNQDGVLYVHTMEINGNAELAQPGAQVSVQRADCRVRGGSKDEIEVRGGVTNGTGSMLAAGAQVTLTLAQRGGTTRTLAAQVVSSLDSPGFGHYMLKATNLRYDAAAGCPTVVNVQATIDGVQVVSPAFEVSAR